jgi:hypothetical protein
MSGGGLPDEIWERIARELPPSANPALIRSRLAAWVPVYREKNFPDSYLTQREVARAKNLKVAQAARTLLATYDFGMAFREGPTIPEIAEEHAALVQGLTQVLRTADDNLQKLGRSGPVRQRPRDVFLGMVVALWHEHGGAITTTTDPVTGDASGRLVRVLVAVAEAAGFPLTPHQARAVVRKTRLAKTPRQAG